MLRYFYVFGEELALFITSLLLNSLIILETR